MTTFHIYCDESCHLEHDDRGVMVLGSIMCHAEARHGLFVALRDLKIRHGLQPTFEMKWTKVSEKKWAFYQDVIDFFFDQRALRFRAVVVPDKSKLRHVDFAQTHDDFYFKMYFQLLQFWFDDAHDYRVFIDIKDTRSWDKTQKLHDVLANSKYDFDRSIIRNIQLVRSEEVELVQLADLLIGAVGYAHRGLKSSPGKLHFIEHVRHRSRRDLLRSTPLGESKFNLFVWRAREVAQ